MCILAVYTYLHSLLLLTSVLDGGESLTVRPQYLLKMRLGVPQSWSVHFGQQDNLMSLLAIKPGPLVTQHTAHTTLTVLPSKIYLTVIKSNRRLEMPVYV
jgi:hypothetical protein